VVAVSLATVLVDYADTTGVFIGYIPLYT
jgi:hypothetical protein